MNYTTSYDWEKDEDYLQFLHENIEAMYKDWEKYLNDMGLSTEEGQLLFDGLVHEIDQYAPSTLSNSGITVPERRGDGTKVEGFVPGSNGLDQAIDMIDELYTEGYIS